MTKVEGMKGYIEYPEKKKKYLQHILIIEDKKKKKKLIGDLLKNCKA